MVGSPRWQDVIKPVKSQQGCRLHGGGEVDHRKAGLGLTDGQDGVKRSHRGVGVPYKVFASVLLILNVHGIHNLTGYNPRKQSVLPPSSTILPSLTCQYLSVYRPQFLLAQGRYI